MDHYDTVHCRKDCHIQTETGSHISQSMRKTHTHHNSSSCQGLLESHKLLLFLKTFLVQLHPIKKLWLYDKAQLQKRIKCLSKPLQDACQSCHVLKLLIMYEPYRQSLIVICTTVCMLLCSTYSTRKKTTYRILIWMELDS